MGVKVTRAGKLNRLPAKVDAGIRKGMHTSGIRIVSRAKRVFSIFRPKGTATGATKRSITTSRVMRVRSTYLMAVGPGTDQAQYLHKRTPPQRLPPKKKILEWLKTKPGTRGLPESALYPIMLATRKTIAARGTAAFPFMTVALNKEKDEVGKIILNSVIRELSKP